MICLQAENVVLTLRDLFQVVYENKKKEMEAAKKQQTEPTDAATKEETPQTGKMPHTFVNWFSFGLMKMKRLCVIFTFQISNQH